MTLSLSFDDFPINGLIAPAMRAGFGILIDTFGAGGGFLMTAPPMAVAVAAKADRVVASPGIFPVRETVGHR